MTILLQEKLLKLCITFAQLKETPRVRAGSKLKKGGGREGRQKNTELFFFLLFPLTRLSISPCCSCTKRALIAAM